MARPRLISLEVCLTPTQCVRALRELAEAADWDWTREEGSRLVDRWAVIMPIARPTRTFRIAITEGAGMGIILTAWSETPGSAGQLTKVELIVPDHLTGGPLRELLRAWSARQPRAPWRWNWRERSVIGFLLPVFRRAPRTFRGHGVATDTWPMAAPEWPPEDWPVPPGEEE